MFTFSTKMPRVSLQQAIQLTSKHMQRIQVNGFYTVKDNSLKGYIGVILFNL